jgi:hypothetical protein
MEASVKSCQTIPPGCKLQRQNGFPRRTLKHAVMEEIFNKFFKNLQLKPTDLPTLQEPSWVRSSIDYYVGTAIYKV